MSGNGGRGESRTLTVLQDWAGFKSVGLPLPHSSALGNKKGVRCNAPQETPRQKRIVIWFRDFFSL